MATGIPGVRGVDHVGINVPDLDEAERFLTDVLGYEHIYTLPGKRAADDWMAVHLGVDPRTVIREIRFYRIGHGSNLEVFEYQPVTPAAPPPLNSDDGGHHLALYVEDMAAAIAHLRAHGVEVMGDPTPSAGPAKGQQWVYFRAPWGLHFELVSFPGGKAYESTAAKLLWNPTQPAR